MPGAQRYWMRGRYAGRVDVPYSTLGPYDPAYSGTSVVLTQLHCHTTASDGTHTPATIVEYYLEAGYEALAITDHDKMTDASPPGSPRPSAATR